MLAVSMKRVWDTRCYSAALGKSRHLNLREEMREGVCGTPLLPTDQIARYLDCIHLSEGTDLKGMGTELFIRSLGLDFSTKASRC